MVYELIQSKQTMHTTCIMTMKMERTNLTLCDSNDEVLLLILGRKMDLEIKVTLKNLSFPSKKRKEKKSCGQRD